MAATLDALEEALKTESIEDLPLHSQVRRALLKVIETGFDDGDKFYTEMAIASRLKVSAGTVRHALADLTREGILVRRVAQGTFVRKPKASGRHAGSALCVLLPQWDSETFSWMLEELERLAAGRSLRMEVHRAPRGASAADAAALVRYAPAEAVVVLMGTLPDMTADLNEILEARGFRPVTIDTLVPDFYGRYVGTDNEQSIKIGLEHLTELGHRRIALLINEPNDQLTVALKIEAFRKLSEPLGIGPSVVMPSMERWQSAFEIAYGAMPELWNCPDRPTAIMTMSDYGAFGVLKWLGEQGISVPKEVSVLGFESLPSGRFTHPALTSIAHPVRQIMHRTLDLFESQDRKQEFLAPELVVRESTGPPPS